MSVNSSAFLAQVSCVGRGVLSAGRGAGLLQGAAPGRTGSALRRSRHESRARRRSGTRHPSAHSLGAELPLARQAGGAELARDRGPARFPVPQLPLPGANPSESLFSSMCSISKKLSMILCFSTNSNLPCFLFFMKTLPFPSSWPRRPLPTTR